MNQFDPYLFFDGDCAEAMRFYEQTLGGKIEMMMKVSESPMPMEGAPRDAVMHASLQVDGRRLLASDWMSPEPYPGLKGTALAVAYPTVDEATRVFDALAAGGTVNMPMGSTFWIERFGMLTDRFGMHWMVSGGKPAEMPSAKD